MERFAEDIKKLEESVVAKCEEEPQAWEISMGFQEVALEKLPAELSAEACARLELMAEVYSEQDPMLEAAASAQDISFGTSYRHTSTDELKTTLKNARRKANYHEKRAAEMVTVNSWGGSGYPRTSISDHKWKAKMARKEVEQIIRELQRRGS